ncbi:putative suppressor of Mek1 [Rosellinia necatrix]|uniref:Putative suppressor of Mek1 n=1 Tax=Rosellinia necatrix TaxID=77044 RepID=A0A1S7UKI7_ROSNE|nr:putative suppressor of Mek1 [Rosellinia necatrix]
MAAQPVPHPSTDRRRVKVYELRNNDWFDRGTGFCTATFNSSEDVHQRDARVIVESEDQPGRTLLETRICKEDGFHKQQETLIVWTEPTNGVDMALSFQEPEGCAMIWKFIHSIQQQYNPSSAQDDSLSDDLAMEVASQISLPEVSMANLADIEARMRIMSGSANDRDALAKYVVAEHYIDKLIPIVSDAEDLESLADLHRLCNIMKVIILLNDTAIIEYAVSDACVIGVVGALEYDPDFPSHKANHRQWLQGEGRYREVVRIEDRGVTQKIHQTYRLQYLKDVVLARILDDNTFSVLNSLIFFNQVDIVQHLQANSSFLIELFNIFKSGADLTRKKEAVLFIQQCCAIAKNLQPPARQTLYNNFIAHGLLQVIHFGLKSNDVSVRVGATDIMVSMIDHDPQMIRQTIYRQILDKQPLLTDTLIDLLLVETDLGVKSQISDTLRVLLDQGPPIPVETYTKANGEFVTRTRIAQDPQQENFLGLFYGKSAIKLFQPLMALQDRPAMNFTNIEASAFSYLVELLCFFIRQHQHRSKIFVMTHDIVSRVTQLLQSPEKFLKLVAVRFLRQLVGSLDEFYIRHLSEKQAIEPVLDLLIQTIPRDNLISSACLELFEHVKKENIKELVKHMVENYREKLQGLSYMELFRTLLLRYDQTSGFTANMDYFLEAEEDASRDRRRNNRPPPQRNPMEHLTMDEAQEEYWNNSDDEEDLQMKPSDRTLPANGESPNAKPLVDYASDDELDDNIEAGAISSDEGKLGQNIHKADENPMIGAPPPERVSEKRRREEDEEDDLSKMVQHKRRNSTSAGSSPTSSAASTPRRKKMVTGTRDSGGGPKKIAISLSSATKAGDLGGDD